MAYDEHPIFDNHAAFNRYLVYENKRPVDTNTTPSVYISEMKIRKGFARLLDTEIEDLHGDEFNDPAILRLRRELNEKLENLHKWQLFDALYIFVDRGNYACAEYVLRCRHDDKKPERYKYL